MYYTKTRDQVTFRHLSNTSTEFSFLFCYVCLSVTYIQQNFAITSLKTKPLLYIVTPKCVGRDIEWWSIGIRRSQDPIGVVIFMDPNPDTTLDPTVRIIRILVDFEK